MAESRQTAHTEFTGNAGELLSEYQRLREADRELQEERRQNARAAREQAREEQDNLRTAAQLTREVQTPLEQYREKVEQIERAYESGNIDQETYNRQLAMQKQRLEEADVATNKAATSIDNFVKGFAGFLGIQTLISGVRSELEMLRKLADDARVQNLDFAEVVGQTRNAFTADKTLGADQLEQRMIEAGRESRTSPKVFAAAMQDVFSAKGTASNEEAVQAAIAAFQLNPGDLESGRTVAARALDVRQATGSTDMMANIGFIQNLQQNARVTNLRQVGQNIVPAIGGVMTAGDTDEQAGEFVTTLNTLMQDAEGAMTRTAAVSLAQQLREFMPEGGSTMARLQSLQQDPAQASKFLEGASFERAAAPFIEQLVTGTPGALAVQAERIANVGGPDAAAAASLRQQIAQKESSDRAQMLARSQESTVGLEIAELENQGRAREGESRKILEDWLAKTDQSGIDALTDPVLASQFTVRTSFGADPVETARDIMTREGQDLQGTDRDIWIKQLEMLERIASNQQAPTNVPSPAENLSRP